jgi:hypothetical protein
MFRTVIQPTINVANGDYLLECRLSMGHDRAEPIAKLYKQPLDDGLYVSPKYCKIKSQNELLNYCTVLVIVQVKSGSGMCHPVIQV